MRTLLAVLIAGCILSSGCDKKKPDLPLPDISELLPEGRVLSDIGLGELELDPNARDPLTGLGACADLVTYCVHPKGAQSVDGCVASVPRCTTSEPWLEEPCCPDSCVRAYERERRSAEPVAAFDAALFGNGSCYPGVKALLP